MNDKQPPDFSLDTAQLSDGLFKAAGIEQFLTDYSNELQLPQFHEYITELCRQRGEIPERIINRSNIERSFGYQLFKGSRKPSRDTVIQLAYGFDADIALAQTLLKYAGKSPLYARVKRDAAILYCLHNRISLVKTQTVLHELELPLIGGSRR